MPRKCTVCTNKQLAAINKEITAGRPYRAIALNHKLGVQSMYRHVENCLGLSFAAVIEAKKAQGGIDAYREFETLLAKAKTALEAAEKSLTVNGKVDFSPRAWEVDLVWEDFSGEKPVVKTDKLQDVLTRIDKQPGMIPLHTFIKIQDARKTYLDTLARIESVIDRFAKIGGLYNLSDFDRLMTDIRDYLETHPGVDRDYVVNTYAKARGIEATRIWQELGTIG